MNTQEQLNQCWEDYFYNLEKMESTQTLSLKKRHKLAMDNAASRARYLDGLPKADISEKLGTINAIENTGKYGHNGLGKVHGDSSLFRTIPN